MVNSFNNTSSLCTVLTLYLNNTYCILYWPCHIPTCLSVWWQGRPWLMAAIDTNRTVHTRSYSANYFISKDKYKQSWLSVSKMRNSHKVCASPLRQGSRSWLVPLWAASWCHQSSSSPLADSSGCHCRLRQLMLAATCFCPESTKRCRCFWTAERVCESWTALICHLLFHCAVPNAEVWKGKFILGG